MNTKIKNIIGDITTKCIANNISFELSAKEQVYPLDSSVGSSGYFDGDTTKVLAVACGKPEQIWLPTLLHEDSHLDQYLEQSEVWRKQILSCGRDTSTIIFSWVDGQCIDPLSNKPWDKSLLAECAARILELEIDCEKRTLEKIIRYDITELVDPVSYIQKANAYGYFYLYMLETGKFYSSGFEPYTIQEVWSCAPNNFECDYQSIPKDLHRAFRTYLR